MSPVPSSYQDVEIHAHLTLCRPFHPPTRMRKSPPTIPAAWWLSSGPPPTTWISRAVWKDNHSIQTVFFWILSIERGNRDVAPSDIPSFAMLTWWKVVRIWFECPSGPLIIWALSSDTAFLSINNRPNLTAIIFSRPELKPNSKELFYKKFIITHF